LVLLTDSPFDNFTLDDDRLGVSNPSDDEGGGGGGDKDKTTHSSEDELSLSRSILRENRIVTECIYV
jgi:hypothetical protein